MTGGACVESCTRDCISNERILSSRTALTIAEPIEHWEDRQRARTWSAARMREKGGKENEMAALNEPRFIYECGSPVDPTRKRSASLSHQKFHGALICYIKLGRGSMC